jgi:hypothetical protein
MLDSSLEFSIFFIGFKFRTFYPLEFSIDGKRILASWLSYEGS